MTIPIFSCWTGGPSIAMRSRTTRSSIMRSTSDRSLLKKIWMRSTRRTTSSSTSVCHRLYRSEGILNPKTGERVRARARARARSSACLSGLYQLACPDQLALTGAAEAWRVAASLPLGPLGLATSRTPTRRSTWSGTTDDGHRPIHFISSNPTGMTATGPALRPSCMSGGAREYGFGGAICWICGDPDFHPHWRQHPAGLPDDPFYLHCMRDE